MRVYCMLSHLPADNYLTPTSGFCALKPFGIVKDTKKREFYFKKSSLSIFSLIKLKGCVSNFELSENSLKLSFFPGC